MATLKEKFLEEMDYLRRLGKVFVRGNPALEPFLGASAKDPDVERLLEGFAFLTAKVRMKIEDDLPEVTQPMLQVLDPTCLQPTPSMTIMRFTPIEGAIAESHVIPRGTVVQSRPVQGVRCQFRTCSDVSLLPLAIESISDSHSNDASTIRIALAASPGCSLHNLACDNLEFHLSGSEETALTLYGWLGRYLQWAQVDRLGRTFRLPPDCIQFSGFKPEEALLPQAPGKLDGYRILQEYFSYPTRFHFFRLTGLRQIWPTEPCQRVTLEFRFQRPMPLGSRIKTGDLSLFCAPAINLFPHPAEPISLDSPKIAVPLVPDTQSHREPYAIFSVDTVTCARRTTVREGALPVQAFHPYNSLRIHDPEKFDGVYAHDVEVPLVPGEPAHRISFLRGDTTAYVNENEMAQVELTCTNGELPQALVPGDITYPVDTTTNVADFTNITSPTPAYPPQLDGDTQWGWISNLTPTLLTLQSVPALVSFLRVYDLPGLCNIQLARATQRKLDAIRSIKTSPVDRMFKELAVRGTQTHLMVDRDAYSSEGEMHLLFSVVSHALAVFLSAHSFHVLSISTAPDEKPYQWPIRPGTQPLM
ncbi:type VI secretion system baseplate subunit TssF [Pseudomonas aeruginosa]|uniref:type VI secretion system baseplate subunit TssF n=1 Tax=Pseudomonas aeruginosa TaxID=287 RepID=UPI001558AE33|nr:type VI secretion system baseplate subunit TssF [Pseudomonas aeruginosa]NPW32894.1 type VI secretion system baseplate subunit TssF [Pseudomonas aeruginosa]